MADTGIRDYKWHVVWVERRELGGDSPRMNPGAHGAKPPRDYERTDTSSATTGGCLFGKAVGSTVTQIGERAAGGETAFAHCTYVLSSCLRMRLRSAGIQHRVWMTGHQPEQR
jgi:hypothetical protein